MEKTFTCRFKQGKKNIVEIDVKADTLISALTKVSDLFPTITQVVLLTEKTEKNEIQQEITEAHEAQSKKAK